MAAGDRVLTPAAVAGLKDRIFGVADSTGLTGIGDIRIILHYRRRAEYSFDLDMGIV